VTSAWGFAAVVAVVLGSVARELVRLRRLAVRQEAIARLTVQAAPGTVRREQHRWPAPNWPRGAPAPCLADLVRNDSRSCEPPGTHFSNKQLGQSTIGVASLGIPQNLSVVGFDDIAVAAAAPLP